ncbi:MAG: ribonuclease III [Candidatus Melainabacteria bacterium GWF2_32_7]|nr:MAG: ribonuclease III [Candidatus Melainabacteria bacterium GWF2_32_7]
MLNEKRKTELDELLKTINLSVDDYSLLDVALTHSSYGFENKIVEAEDNERLEFLGDAVLKLLASRYLYNRFPEYAEGDLTKIRAILVSDNTLARVADRINLNKYLKLGFHEEKMGGRKRSSTLACAFEALLGAFYLNGEIKKLYDFLVELLKDEVTEIDKSASKYNYKAMLQEYAQANGMPVPDYIVAKEEGPAHNKNFIIEVWVNGDKLGYGEGKSKKEAHQVAAKMAAVALGLLEGHEK